MADKNKEILTINTHKGFYRCNRLMYGVASSPAIWQGPRIENILSDILDITVFLDDKIAEREKKH